MNDGQLKMGPQCRACRAPLTIEEMHYLDHGDGTATCDACETKWMEATKKWRDSNGNDPMPERP